MKKCLICFMFFTLPFVFSGQINAETKRTNWWYFGEGAGINWTSGSPVAVTNGQTYADEGTASISDLLGNLVLYSDGNTIWNKFNIPVQGGYNLLGCNSYSTQVQISQNAAIIPKPNNDSIYYVFSLGCLNFQGYNFNYSTVNIKLNADSGKVISANTFLMRSRCQGIGICRAANGCDTWVVAMDSLGYNCFYKVTSSGVSSIPVKQFGGITYFQNGGVYCNYKFSTTLSMLANTIYTGYGYDTLVLQYFDNNTAFTSNTIRIPTRSGTVYSTAFSPDNTKLYTTMMSNANGGCFSDTLYQYNLAYYNEAAINLSKVMIYGDSVQTGNLQYGIDGKLYVARGINYAARANYDSLSVINYPNNSGIACGFVLNAVSLSGKKCYASLPNFDQAYFYPLLNNSCATGIDEVSLNNFKIFPNPASDFITIENTQGFDFEMQIFDLNNTTIFKGNVKAYERKNVSLINLSKGMYVLKLSNNQNKINFKLLKQ